MEEGGIFCQIFSIPGAGRELFREALGNLKKSFKNHTAFLFSNQLVVLSSDAENPFILRWENSMALNSFLIKHEALQNLFYGDLHILSRCIGTNIDDIMKFFSTSLEQDSSLDFEAVKSYLESGDRILKLADRNYPNHTLAQNLTGAIIGNARILSLLKSAELSESRGEYENETRDLFELKRYAEYNSDLKRYITRVLLYKEEHYFHAAVAFEKEKKWDEAKKLYRAILAINPSNFDANYRLGELCQTIQDFEGARTFIQNALRLKPGHPRALFLMGVLMFTDGKFNEAVSYFNQALQGKEKSAQIYYYLGQTYEALKNAEEAERYYEKAQFEDPNSEEIKSKLLQLKEKKEKPADQSKAPEQRNQLDDEKGEKMPLPVNKSAIDIRLKEEDVSEKDKKSQ